MSDYIMTPTLSVAPSTFKQIGGVSSMIIGSPWQHKSSILYEKTLFDIGNQCFTIGGRPFTYSKLNILALNRIVWKS